MYPKLLRIFQLKVTILVLISSFFIFLSCDLQSEVSVSFINQSEMKNRFSVQESTFKKVYNLVQVHLSRFKSYPDFGKPNIQNVFPLLDLSGQRGTFFEVKLTSEDYSNHGYIIVSLSQNYLPILKFAMRGESHVERLKKRVGHWHFNAVFFSPFYITAEDDEGKLLSALGTRPAFLNDEPQPLKKKLSDYASFKKRFLKHQDDVSKAKRELIQKAWKRIFEISSENLIAGTGDYIDVDDLPVHNYQKLTADHHYSIPRYTQIPDGEGANTHNFMSGCVACAWMCLIGYYDNTFTPDLLRGTHIGNSIGFNGYQDHTMMKLSQHLGTENCDGEGCVYLDDIDRGYSFITGELGYTILERKKTENGGMDALQIVYDYLCWSVPSIIATEDHACLAYEVWANMDSDSEDHFVKVFKGLSGPSSSSSYYQEYMNDPFIPFEELAGAWTLKHIHPNTKVDLDRTTIARPAVAELGRKLLIAYRKEDCNIGLLFFSDGQTVETEKTLMATGRGAPDVAVEPSGKYFYIAWREENNKLKLVKGEISNYTTAELKAPPDSSAKNPAITVLNGKLFFQWENNIAYTTLDRLEKSGVPWPTSPLDQSTNECAWKSLGLWASSVHPSLTTDGVILYLGFRHPNEGDCVMLLDEHGNIINYGWHMWFECATNVYFFNRTMYACDGNTIWQLNEHPVNWYDVEGNLAGTTYWCWPREILWPNMVPCQQDFMSMAVLGSFSAPQFAIGPCLLTAWVDWQGKMHIQYHSVDRPETPLDYTGWF